MKRWQLYGDRCGQQTEKAQYEVITGMDEDGHRGAATLADDAQDQAEEKDRQRRRRQAILGTDPYKKGRTPICRCEGRRVASFGAPERCQVVGRPVLQAFSEGDGSGRHRQKDQDETDAGTFQGLGSTRPTEYPFPLG